MLEMDVSLLIYYQMKQLFIKRINGGWFSLAEIQELDLLPADRKVVDQLLKSVGKRSDDGKS